MRSAVLTGASLMLTMAVIGNAYYQRQQFYPSTVYITKSNASMAVIYAQAFVFVCLLGKLMRKIFFGQLRTAEFEHLLERSWYAVTETCLAFTVFKDDFSPKFVALFTWLLFLKSFHWIAEERVDFMERSPSISVLFHVRVLSLAFILAAVDCDSIVHAFSHTVLKGPSVQLVFGFEYAVLLTIVVNTVVKYILHCIDLYSETPWENKAVFMLYTELILGFIKVLLYGLFILIMVRIYTLPLFAVRPMYLTLRALKKALNDIILSRRAINNMNNWFQATEEELAILDNVCIICREEMLAPTTKKLPCNHIFHMACLRSWFQRQQTCPTCRLDVLRAPVSPQRPQQQQQQPQQQPQSQNQPPPQQPQPPQPPQTQPHLGLQQPQQPEMLDVNMLALLAAMANGPRAAMSTTPSSAATTSQTSRSGTSSAAGTPGRPPFVPPFLSSSPPFFPAPHSVPFSLPPPPMPPPNFSGLTTEELEAMEGNERQNVEARIKCLRGIQILLDAAVLEMQQYSAVVSRQALGVPPTVPAAAAATSTTQATGARPKIVISGDKSERQDEQEPGPDQNQQPEQMERVDKKQEQMQEQDQELLLKKMDHSDLGSEQQMELRQRRLKKFGTQPPVD